MKKNEKDVSEKKGKKKHGSGIQKIAIGVALKFTKIVGDGKEFHR